MLYKTNEEEEKEFKQGKKTISLFSIAIMIAFMGLFIWEYYFPAELPKDAGIEDLYHKFAILSMAAVFLFLLLLTMIMDLYVSMKYYRRRLEATIKIIQDTDEMFAECFEDPDYWRETPVNTPNESEEVLREQKNSAEEDPSEKDD